MDTPREPMLGEDGMTATATDDVVLAPQLPGSDGSEQTRSPREEERTDDAVAPANERRRSADADRAA